MADGNGISITNVTANAQLYVLGETMSIGFAFKNGSGVKIPQLVLDVCVLLKDFSGGTESTPILLHRIAGTNAITGENVNLATGKSKTFAAAFAIPDTLAQYFSSYSSIRAVPVYIQYSALNTADGNFGGAFQLEGLHILNRRYNPSVSVFALERAANGVANDEGINVLTDLKLALSTTTNYSSFLTARIHYSQDDAATTADASISLTGSISTLLSGVTDSATLITSTFSNGSDWDFLLVFGDAYESVSVHTALFRAFANMHLSGASTGGVCFGGFSTSTEGNPKTESHYPIYPYGGIKAVSGGATVQTLAFDSDAPFLAYGDNPLQPTLRVFGHVVELHGEIQPTKALTGGTTYYPICTIPEQYAPEHDLTVLQQGTTQAIWMLRIFGKNHAEYPCKAMLSRYRKGDTWADATTSTWLPLHAMWSINSGADDGSAASAALLQDSTESYVLDSNGNQIAVASDTPTVQLTHTAAQVDQAIDRTDVLYSAYTSGELKGEQGEQGPQGEKGDTGAQGPQGPQGENGNDGYTPVRGTDYWTEADKTEIINATLAALPVYAGEVEDA